MYPGTMHTKELRNRIVALGETHCETLDELIALLCQGSDCEHAVVKALFLAQYPDLDTKETS